MRRFRLVSLLLVAGLRSPIASAEPLDYRLGPEDKLQVKVFDWRTGAGQAYQWEALNGDFIVGAGGRLSLPLIGDIDANDATTAAVAATIAERLQTKIGLAQRPDASVQVIKYRPFYIMGVVDKQGEYDYRPDMSVLQAVSLAGGLARKADGGAAGLEREVLAGRGDLRALTAEKTQLMIRQVRLDAEIAESDAIVFPPALAARQAEPEVARAMHEEQALFDTRRESLQSQTDTINQTRSLLDHQMTALAAKDASLSRQLSVTRQELDQISGLVSQGLAVLPRKLAIEENAAQYESSRIDVQLAALHAQQDRSKADRDIAEVRAKERNDALIEAAQVRGRLAEVVQKLETTRTLVYDAEVRAPAALAAASPIHPMPIYSIVRKIDGRATILQVEDTDPVLPGDVVKVDLAQPELSTPAPDAARSSLEGTHAAAVSD